MIKNKSLTEQNGLRMKRATKKWSRLLENTKKFAPIKSQQAKGVTAMLLENQMRSLTEAATNSSILGPANGMTGGALATGDNYATGDFRLPRVLIPMVRRIYPALMANEVVGVQPMPGPIALGFALRYKYEKGPLHHGDTGTRHAHKFNEAVAADEEAGTDAVAASVGAPRGQRGVEATIVYPGIKADKTTSEDLFTVINGQDYPLAQPLYTVSSGGGQFIALVSQPVQSLIGEVKNTQGKVVSAIGSTPSEALTDLKTVATKDGTLVDAFIKEKIAEWDGQKVVGISFNETAIAPGAANSGMGNTEMGYQRLDTRYTGRADARLGEELAGGRWKFRPEDTGIAALMQQFEDTGAVAKTKFGFEKKSVEAGTRRLATSWTLETQEDLKNTNGIDIEDEATQQMSFELQAEIDRECVVRMLYTALTNNEWSIWDGQLADARWMGERARAFYQNVMKRSARMEVRNRRGPANFIICTPDVAVLFESLDEFVTMPVTSSVSTSTLASPKLGTVGKFSVYVDTRTAVYDSGDYGAGYDDMFDSEGKGTELPNYCLLGYKGAENYDAGIIYCPYIPIMIQKAVDPYSFSPNVGLFTRYGMLDNIFGAHLYYHMIIVDSFSQPGLSGTGAAMYPAGGLNYAQASDYVAPTGTTQYAFPVTGAVTGAVDITDVTPSEEV